ncbi:hypothetical protein EMCRGX_G000587 [Ephydatia muelleri]
MLSSLLWDFALVLCFTANSAYESPSQLAFTTQPQGGFYLQGSAVSLRCAGAAESNLTIRWVHNDSIVVPDSSRTANGGSLTIVSLSPALSGGYRCLATGSGGTATSAIALVRVAMLEFNPLSSNPDNPQLVKVTAGVPVALSCGTILSSPPAIVSWKALTGFASQISESATMKNGSLFLKSPGVSNNNKVYTCNPYIVVGVHDTFTATSTGYIKVVVEVPVYRMPSPLPMVQPQDVQANPGEDVVMECLVGGSPVPSISWLYKTNDNMATDSRVETLFDHSILVLPGVTMDDEGVFVCIVGGGVANYSATLTINRPPVMDANNSIPLETRNVLFGAPITLSCSAGGDGLVWLWYHSGMIMEVSSNTLVVPSSTLADSGIYQCFAYNSASYASATGNVSVYDLPATFAPQGMLSDEVVFIGQPLELACTATGVPPPTYHWFKDLLPLSPSSMISTDSVSGRLYIGTTNSSHTGTYTCRATNEIAGVGIIGDVTTSASIYVIEETRVTQFVQSNLSVMVGEKVTLPCVATSAEGTHLSYLWTRNGIPLDVDGERLYYASNETGTAVINGTEVRDTGLYQCIVETTFSRVPSQVFITNSTLSDVTVSSTFAPGGMLSDEVVFIGQPLELACTATGVPPPTYQWFKDLLPLSPSSMISIDSVSGRLYIGTTNSSHTGTYTCRATNEIAGVGIIGDVTTSASIYVIEETTITQLVPGRHSVMVGEKVALPCVATSAEGTHLSYTWTRNGIPLDVDGERLYYANDTGIVVINGTELGDTGAYQCTVQTTFLNVSSPAPNVSSPFSTVTVYSIPVLVAVRALDATVISVTWAYNATTPGLQGCQVQVKELGSGGQSKTVPVRRAATVATVGSLTPFTAYEVQVVAILNDGTLLGSKVSTTMTLQAAPTEAPSGLLATPTSVTEFQLTWKAPSKSGSSGILTDYCVQYREEGSNGPYTEVYVGSNDTMYLLTGLKPLFSYEVRVAANTSVGRGPFTSMTITAIQFSTSAATSDELPTTVTSDGLVPSPTTVTSDGLPTTVTSDGLVPSPTTVTSDGLVPSPTTALAVPSPTQSL